MKSVYGLTLIEVLIALAIVGIALTAIIKATAQNIHGTEHLQTKSVATWVGEYILTEAQLGLLKLPTTDDMLQEKITMLGNELYWQAQTTTTSNQRIKKVAVRVYAQEPEHEDVIPIMQLEGYVYPEVKENVDAVATE